MLYKLFFTEKMIASNYETKTKRELLISENHQI